MIIIPDSFQVQPFYYQKTIYLPDLNRSFKDICRAVPFYYDMVEEEIFWKNKHDIIPVIFEWWNEEEQTLTSLYRERNSKKAKPIMITMIAAFIDCLFWMNNKKLTGLNQLKEALAPFKFKPVNCVERLDFLLLNPSQFHSFTQLRALFLEMKKIYAKMKVIEHKV
ncbi:YpoC family protein [Alkalihalobacillus deserti]|uniref:YpoC family protein n=1 Tax=Alkalihalobacillus deserti TaxID=2879466 RepID=UPI001D13AFC7|nr:hypothetical protein [Alkalihalobacillus deserti]